MTPDVWDLRDQLNRLQANYEQALDALREVHALCDPEYDEAIREVVEVLMDDLDETL